MSDMLIEEAKAIQEQLEYLAEKRARENAGKSRCDRCTPDRQCPSCETSDATIFASGSHP